MEKEEMPKVNLSKDSLRLTTSDLFYMNKVHAQNLERVAKLKKMRKANYITGIALGSLALAIYSYTIYAVKQEKFLDDFEEPEKISDEE